MNKVNGETLNAILLIAILGFYGCRLANEAWTLHQRGQMLQAVVDQNRKLVFGLEAGIDVSGTPVHVQTLNSTKRTIVFLLHGASIKADLKFWRSMEAALPVDSALRLVGYCNNDTCAEAVRREAPVADFPVIAYGEIVSSQALVNADGDGNAILRNASHLETRYVAWRVPGKSPEDVAREVIR